jgi:hypothetical protein
MLCFALFKEPIGIPSADLSLQPSSQMMSIKEDHWAWLEEFKGFPEDSILSARLKKSSVEEGKGEFRRTDALLSAYYALAKGTNRQGQWKRESAKLNSKEIGKIKLGKSSSLIDFLHKELIALKRRY